MSDQDDPFQVWSMVNEPTLGELMRRFDRLEKHVDAKFKEVLASNVYQRDYDHLDGRITAVEERIRWITRQIIIVALPLVAAAIVAVLASQS